MCVRHPGFEFLLWFSAVLLVSAQSAEQTCSPPVLDNGFVLTPQITYNHDQTITYSCDIGHKPAVEGWWATVTCLNGKWSPEPKCIDESSCLPPDNVPNTKYSQSRTGWFKNSSKIQIRCDHGYKTQNNSFTAKCVDGAWASLPVCERSEDSCSEPPQLPHAVIINQKYQEVFAGDSVVEYQCEDGYTTEQGHNKKPVYCLNGAWASLPICEKSKDYCSEPPQLPHAVIINQKYQEVFAEGSVVEYQCEDGYTTEQGDNKKPVYCLDGTWTEGPTCKQSDSGPFIPVSNCGRFPNVPHSEVKQINSVSLKYICTAPYKLTGPEVVVCHSGGTWSDLPTCKAERHCVLDPQQYPYGHWIPQYRGGNLPEGETIYPRCHTDYPYTRAVKCNDGRLTVAKDCCFYQDSVKGLCW